MPLMLSDNTLYLFARAHIILHAQVEASLVFTQAKRTANFHLLLVISWDKVVINEATWRSDARVIWQRERRPAGAPLKIMCCGNSHASDYSEQLLDQRHRTAHTSQSQSGTPALSQSQPSTEQVLSYRDSPETLVLIKARTNFTVFVMNTESFYFFCTMQIWTLP